MATPHCASKDIHRHKDFTRSKPRTSLLFWSTSLNNAASSLGGFSRPTTFLPTTCTTLSLFKLCTRPLRLTCLKQSSLTPTPLPRTLQMILKRRLTPRLVLDSLLFLAFVVLRFVFFLYMLLWETYRDCFHDFSFSLRFREVSHVEG